MQPTPDQPLPRVILAPVSGELTRLEDVPDPVFAQKMVGDGVAIDPLDSVLLSPCDGEVIQLHPAGHAVTVRTIDGIEVLMHIGIDTVKLQGQGFSPKVKPGDRVRAGAPLVAFDLDFVATRAKSLLTLVLVTTMDRVASLQPGGGMVTAGKHPAFTFSLKGAAAGSVGDVGEEERVTSEAVIIPNLAGLHARPSAALAGLAKLFRSDIRLHLGGQHANAKSVTALMTLDVQHGSSVVVSAKGDDAREAVARLEALLRQGLGEEIHHPAPAPVPVRAPEPPVRRPANDPNVILGVTASPGLAAGNIFQVRHGEISIVENADDPDRERARLRAAIERAKEQLAALRMQLQTDGDPDRAAIFAAHAALAEDPALAETALTAIAGGKSAAFAWKAAFESAAGLLAGMANETLAQRGSDLRDVGARVLEALTGAERKKRAYPKNAIIIAEDLTPSDTAALDRACVRGFCTTRGGATSHVAILAQSLGIPALVNVDPRALEIPNGALATLNASQGFLRLKSSFAEMNEVLRAQQKAEDLRQLQLGQAHEHAVTLDGRRLEVVANIAGLEDARRLGDFGGEGVGLLRSEFLFLERASAPSEDEQFEAYKAIAQAVGRERPLTIRTLDVGGDKPLAYLPIPPEDNPFLGERGIRVGLNRPEELRAQLRAILRASAFGKVRIMFPMIATLTELREARTLLAEEGANLGIAPVPAGIMVEVPATAILAEQFAREADFFSIGTNDLTQYTLAMDRNHPKLAPQVDGLNPAVLRLIEQSVAGAHAHGIRVGVCGGIAGDAHAAPLLIGLGVDELSVSPPAIPALKAQIRTLSLAACRELAREALQCDTVAEVRGLVSRSLNR